MWRLTLALSLASAALSAELPLAVPFFPQQKDGCGAASVAMVMHYWNPEHPAPKAVHASLYNTKLHGIPLGEMKRYLETQGFRAYSFHGGRADLETHLAKGRPVIVALRKKLNGPLHFAVLTGLTLDEVLLNDPTRPRTIRLKQTEFENRWRQADTWMLLAVPTNSTSPRTTVTVPASISKMEAVQGHPEQ